MIGDENKSPEADWTKENLLKLFAAMKTNIPVTASQQPYKKWLNAVDWQSVAFPPFSPEACQAKWGQLLEKMRKTRSLTELIEEAQKNISSSCTKRKKVRQEVPKRPSPPNAIFLRENWAAFHEKNPTMDNRKLLRLLSREYKALSEDKKADYEKKFKVSMKEYKKRMKSKKNKQCSSQQKATRKRKMFIKDNPEIENVDGWPTKPPVSGYTLFCKEQAKSMTGVALCSYKKVWATRWQGLTEVQKEEYGARCKELKRQYKVELKDCITKLDIDTQRQISKKHGIDITKVIQTEVSLTEPKMPPRACNAIFFRDQMKLLKTEFPNSKERFIEASQKWNALSNQEKESYRVKSNKINLDYQLELQKWFQTLKPEEQDDYLRQKPNKRKFLDVSEQNALDRKDNLFLPSDSEDEEMEYSSSNETDHSESEEEEQEDDMEDIMFTIF